MRKIYGNEIRLTLSALQTPSTVETHLPPPKVDFFGLDKMSINLFTCYLSGRSQITKFECKTSTCYPFVVGVPQGSHGRITATTRVSEFAKDTNILYFLIPLHPHFV